MTSVFISHSGADKLLARRVANALTRAGVRAWLDEREIPVGEDIPQAIARGISGTDYFALLLTRQSVDSRWVREELSAALMGQVEAGDRRVLPLLFEACEIPPLLKAKRYADFRHDFQTGLSELLAAIGVHSPPPIPKFDHDDVLDALSLIWDSRGKYRGLTWNDVIAEVHRTRAGVHILTEDLLELVEYKPAPFREHTTVLRAAARALLAGAVQGDAELLAQVVVSAWEEHKDNIGAAWLLVFTRKDVATAVLAKAFQKSPATAKWLMRTLYDFVGQSEDGSECFEAELIKRAGSLPVELLAITRDDGLSLGSG